MLHGTRPHLSVGALDSQRSPKRRSTQASEKLSGGPSPASSAIRHARGHLECHDTFVSAETVTSTSPAESMIEIARVHRLRREAAALRKAVGAAKLSTVAVRS